MTAIDAYKHENLQLEYGWERPIANAGFAAGKNTTTNYTKSHDDEERTKDANGPDGFHAGAGAKVEGSANAFQAETGEFTLNPDGSGYGGKIINTFGEFKGSGKAGVEGGCTPKEGGDLSAGVEAGGEATAAGKVFGERYWAITVNPDGTCRQSSINVEGGAALGAAAKYQGKYGLDGFESKGSIGLGAYLTGGGGVNYGKQFECPNPFANPGVPLNKEGGGSELGGSTNGKSITAIETEAEAMDQATEGHAKRAESAAQRAVAAAHRAAAARAQMQALLSGI